jgi:predicted transcriptional regulator
LAALKLHGNKAACELSEITGLTVVQLDRRLVELQDKGLICVVRSNGVDVTVNGCRVWSLTEKQLAG